MGKSFRKSLGIFASQTTIHGMNDLVNSENHVMRVVWGLITLFSLSMLAYMLYLVIYQYKTSPTSYQSSVIPDYQFPKIRIYAQNFASYQKAFESWGAFEGEAFKSAFVYYVGYFYEWTFTVTDKAIAAGSKMGFNSQNQISNLLLRQEFENLETNMSSVTDFMQKVMFQPDELLDLNQTDNSYIINTTTEIDEFGVSYVIDAAKNNDSDASMKRANMHAANIQFGVKNLVKMPPIVPHGRLMKPTGSIPSPTGYIITFGSELHDKSRWVVPKANMVYRVLVSPVKRRMISTKQNPCQASGISVGKCLQQCDMLQDACTWNCDWFPRKSDPPRKICNQFLVKSDIVNKTRQSHCAEITSGCEKKCLEPCEAWEYNLQILEGEFVDPNVTIINSIDPSTKKSPVGDASKVQIHPNTSTATGEAAYEAALPNTNVFVITIVNGWRATMVEEYYVYTWSSLLSNIGGLVGLCIGASIISLFHVIFFWVFKTRVKREVDIEANA